ncbi:MAG: hypothetical protein H8E59_05885 [Actinobacteria bacterium]|nr:hypothetical protein [Actinomycetota bacterium]
MIPEAIGAVGLVMAAVVTGLFQRARRENDEAHGRSIEQIERIATTVEHIDEQVDEIAEWQVEHEKLHEGAG